MYNLTNGNQTWKNVASGLWNASSVFLSGDSDNILTEVACERNDRCDPDQRAFKGLTARSYARAAIAAPFLDSQITPVLEASAKAAVGNCDTSEDPGFEIQCALIWNRDEDAGTGDLSSLFSALEVVQGLLYPSAKALATANEATNGPTAVGNATQNAGASGTSRAGAPEKTGAAGMVAGSVTAVLAVAFAAALSC
jgi:mannan endo-1,6-alpha-mannosidase